MNPVGYYKYRVITYSHKKPTPSNVGFDSYDGCLDQIALIEQYIDKNKTYRIEIVEDGEVIWHKNIGT